MAKKAVGKVRGGGAKGKTRCIKMVRSEKSGSYNFKDEMHEGDDVTSFFAAKR